MVSFRRIRILLGLGIIPRRTIYWPMEIVICISDILFIIHFIIHMPEIITTPYASISLTFTKVGSPVIKPYTT